ncbi:MAG: class I SAM-dependent methyltransferase [Cyanobacteria bacterium P01_F01_bin.116]
MLLSNTINKGMEHLILGMKEIKQHYAPSQWQEFSQTTVLQHPVTSIIHQCPFTHHAFTKPRSYAGDADLLDFIYGFKDLSPSLSPLGIKLCKYMQAAPAPTSVRARRDILAQTIDQVVLETSHPAQILSIACGHLREAKHSIAFLSGSIGKLIAFDQDSLSLALIDYELSKDFLQTLQGSVTDLVKQKHHFENLDLVYAAGLYDYLSQPFATRLTKIMFDMLRPQGKLLVANFIPDHRDVGYMETFMQWNLIYRTESQLDDVAKAIPAAEIAQKQTFFEPNGNIVFLELVKA